MSTTMTIACSTQSWFGSGVVPVLSQIQIQLFYCLLPGQYLLGPPYFSLLIFRPFWGFPLPLTPWVPVPSVWSLSWGLSPMPTHWAYLTLESLLARTSHWLCVGAGIFFSTSGWISSNIRIMYLLRQLIMHGVNWFWKNFRFWHGQYPFTMLAISAIVMWATL